MSFYDARTRHLISDSSLLPLSTRDQHELINAYKLEQGNKKVNGSGLLPQVVDYKGKKYVLCSKNNKTRIHDLTPLGLMGSGTYCQAYEILRHDKGTRKALKIGKIDENYTNRHFRLDMINEMAIAKCLHGTRQVPGIVRSGILVESYYITHRYDYDGARWLQGQKPNLFLRLNACMQVLIASHHMHESGVIPWDIKLNNCLVEVNSKKEGFRFRFSDLADYLHTDRFEIWRPESLGKIPCILYSPETVYREDALLLESLLEKIQKNEASRERIKEYCETLKILSPQMALYSIGVILYQLITGELKYPHKLEPLPKEHRFNASQEEEEGVSKTPQKVFKAGTELKEGVLEHLKKNLNCPSPIVTLIKRLLHPDRNKRPLPAEGIRLFSKGLKGFQESKNLLQKFKEWIEKYNNGNKSESWSQRYLDISRKKKGKCHQPR